MGKLGISSLAVIAGLAAGLLPSRLAAAQDFGQNWIDRVTHELEQERGPLTPKAFNWNADVGVEYAFDNNIFLTQTDKKSDSIVIPFVQAGLSYAEPHFDAEASLLADYKYYLKEKADDDEERVFLRARQTSNRWNFEISELFMNVSDPSGVLFLNRVSRIISTTVPKIALDMGRNLSLELNGNIQIIRFKQEPYRAGQDNNNFSAEGAVVYSTPWGFELLGIFGYYDINYLTDSGLPNGTPHVFGYYGKAGFRGNLLERVYIEGNVGYSSADTDFFPTTGRDISTGTGVFNLNLKYEATSTLNFFLDGTRMYTFDGFGDPYQLLNTFTAMAELEVAEGLKLRVRAQYDHSVSALNLTRNYLNGNVGMTYQFSSHWIFDASAGYRWGKSENNLGNAHFDDVLFQAGVAFTW